MQGILNSPFVGNNLSKSEIIIWRFLLSLLALAFIPSIFVGFDAHHDGLILTTIRELQFAYHSGGPWPFNQYGPSWTLPFLFLTMIVPQNLLFISIRCLVVLFYFISAFLLFTSVSKFLSKRYAYISSIFFLASQPFSTKLSSDLIPWPSAFTMILSALIFQLYVSKFRSNNTKHQNLYLLSIGGVIPWILTSRIQIGALLVVVALLLLRHERRRQELVWLASGFSISGIFLSLFLLSKGWLVESFIDEVVFGSLYIRGDTSTYPKPIWTILGTLFLILVFLTLPRVINFLDNKTRRKIFLFFCIFAIVIFTFIAQKVLLARKLDATDQLVVFSRRLWICLTLASLIFAFLDHYRAAWKFKKLGINTSSDFLIQRSLIMISLAAEFQIYPLFDQMHYWWGSLPAVVVMTQVIRSRIFVPLLNLGISRKMLVPSIILIVLFSLAPLLNNLQVKRVPYPASIAKLLFVYPEDSKDEKDLQNFFHSHLRGGEKVLNLCSNTNIFFIPNEYRSSTRLFLFWYPFEMIPEYGKEYQSSRESAIVTCSESYLVAFAQKTEARKSAIVSQKFRFPKLIGVYTNSQGRVWKIFRNENS